MTTKPHVAEADRIQREIIRKMTPAQKFAIARELYDTAWEIKKSALRAQHPDWTEEQVHARVKRIFTTGYAGD
ncbi:MAG: hypothetical protein RL630_413 [Verrucomicrobiota bacterium]